jgi:hypothetical protein
MPDVNGVLPRSAQRLPKADCALIHVEAQRLAIGRHRLDLRGAHQLEAHGLVNHAPRQLVKLRDHLSGVPRGEELRNHFGADSTNHRLTEAAKRIDEDVRKVGNRPKTSWLRSLRLIGPFGAGA